MSSDYDAIYSQDTPSTGPHGWIQWKGTDVCMDLYCKCGQSTHFDGEFFYHFECPYCGTRYAVGQVVKLIELTPEQASADGRHFKTGERDDD